MGDNREKADLIANQASRLAAGEKRDAYVAEQCAGEPELYKAVTDRLREFALRAFAYASEQSATETTGEQTIHSQQTLVDDVRERGRTVANPGAEQPGDQIGDFKLLEAIGEGGFGTVWLAEQRVPVVRRVALKVIKLGMDTKEFIARFELERQALAMMDHPGIARVLDAGASALGRPYFAMEFVRGVPINLYCDDRKLPVRARLDLFVQICEAIQHAHQKGIIHRDLKPSNLLVGDVSGRPQVKVIDFGIAKAIDQRLTENTLFTRRGQLIGTPEYMSPEQAESGGLDVDTRADVYALGVILYELVTGQCPLDSELVRTASVDELQRMIRHTEPARPSTRLSNEGEAKVIEIAKRRGTVPEKLRRMVHGDLDWIAMKALEKDRNRRYESASAFAADIRRFVASEPVSARPPSVAYQMQKFARRNKKTLAAVTTMIFLLIAGSVVSVWQALRATSASRAAVKAETLVRKEADRAVVAERSAVSALARMEMENGLNHDDTAEALRWFASAASRELDSETALANSTRFKSWSRLQPLPVAALQVAGEPDAGGLQFHPSEKYLSISYIHESEKQRRVAVLNIDTSEPYAFPTEFRNPVAAAWSPSGQELVVATESGRVGILAFPSAQLKGEIKVPDQFEVSRLLFSQDGRYLALGGNQLKVWDTESKKMVALGLGSGQSKTNTIAFAPDGRSVVVTDIDLTCRSYGISSERELLFPDHRTSLPPCFINSGRTVLTAGSKDAIAYSDAITGQPIADQLFAVDQTYEKALDGAVLSPDGRHYALFGFLAAELYAADSRSRVSIVKGHLNRISDACFSPDGGSLLTASIDRTVKLWSVPDLYQMWSAPHQNELAAVTFSSSGRFWASGQSDGLIRVCHAPNVDDVRMIDVGSQSQAVAISDDEQYLATLGTWNVSVSQHGTRVFEIASGEPAGPVLAANDRIWGGDFSNNGALLATLSTPASAAGPDFGGGSIQFWDWRTGEALYSPIPTASVPLGAQFGPVGDVLAVTCRDGALLIIDGRSGEVLYHEPGAFPGPLSDNRPRTWIEFGPQGDRFATLGHFRETIRIWDLKGNLLQSLKIGAVYDFEFDSRGRYLAVGMAGPDPGAMVWDIVSGQLAAEKIAHPDWVASLTFNDEGDRLLTCCRDHVARLWDWRTGTLAAPVLEHTDEVFAGGLVGERHAVTLQRGVSEGFGRIRFWDVASGREATPPGWLTGFAPKQLFILDGGTSALVSGRCSKVQIFSFNDLFARNSNPKKIGALAELIAGRALPARGGQPLTSAEWFERWSNGLRSGDLAIEVAVDWSPVALQSWHRQQQRYLLDEWEQPKAALWHSAQLDSPSIESQLELVNRDIKLGRFREGLTALDRVLARAPEHREALGIRKDLLLQTGDYDEAIHVYDDALAITPEDPILIFDRGDVHGRLDYWQQAAKDFEYAATVVGDRFLSYLAALTYFAGDDLEDYHRMCGAALLKPHESALQALAIAAQPPESVRQAIAWIEQDKTNRSNASLLGAMHYRAGHWQTARDLLAQAVKLKSDQYPIGFSDDTWMPAGHRVRGLPAAGRPRDWIILSTVMRKLGMTDEAAAWSEKAVLWHDINAKQNARGFRQGSLHQWTEQLLIEQLLKEATVGKD